jgi:integrase
VALRRDGRLHRERIGRNRRDAERALARIVTADDDGSYVAPSRQTFHGYADAWLAAATVRPSTLHAYEGSVAVAKSVIPAGRLLRDIGPGDVDRLLAECRRRKLSGGTTLKHLRVFGSVLRSACRRRLLAANPVEALEPSARPRRRRHEASFFSDDEVVRLLAALEHTGTLRAAFLVALGTGCRSGEVLGLRWGDLELGDAQLRVRRTVSKWGEGPTKGGRVRVVPLPPGLVAELGAWWGTCGKPGDDVLVIPDMDGHALLRGLRAAMRRAGVPVEHPASGERRNFHSLRHSAARRWLEAGATLDYCRTVLGHVSAQTTLLYAAWSDEGTRRMAERIGAEAFPWVPAGSE